MDRLMAAIGAKRIMVFIDRMDNATEEGIRDILLDLAVDGTVATPAPVEVTFGGMAPCKVADCPTAKVAAPGSLHWHAGDLAKGDKTGLAFNLGALPMGAIFATPPEKPVLSCRRHVDCLRAPKGQLCCRDPKCTRMECQVAT